MIRKTVILLCVVLCVLGDEEHATSEQKVMMRHKEMSHIGSQEHEHHEEYAWSYPSFDFSYAVDDPHTHDKKGQSENREGDEVKGEYWLIEPDGRKRIVKYYADKKIGFKADVEYSEPLKHIMEDNKSHHIPHHPDVEHKTIIVDHEEEKKAEEHHEEEKHDEGGDRDGHSSQHMPLTGQYRPIPYRPAVRQYEVQENYHNPRFHRQDRHQ